MPQDTAKLTATLNKKTVPILKEELKALGLPIDGKKADLISRLVEHMQAADKESQENTESSNDKAAEEAPTSTEDTQTTSETPAGEKESPERKRSPSPVEEKKEQSRSRSASKSPVRKERTPSPAKERMEEEQQEPKDDDDKKRKVNETSSSNNGKRQRKWESRGGHNDVSISSDTLDNMITDIPQEEPKPTNGSALRTSDAGLRNSQDTRRVVARKEKEPELPPDQRPPVPAARKPESNTLFIDRFVRPFLPKQVKELLEKTGEVEYFWMNNIRSHCYVTYKTVEQAVATREAVHGLMWPQANKSRLIVEFSSVEEAHRRAEAAEARSQAQQPQQQPQQPQVQQQAPTALSTSALQAVRDSAKEREKDREKERDRERERERDRDRRGERDRLDRERAERDRRERERPPPPPKVTLESLFRKTVARPSIYWLPLTDQEVENKKSAAGASTKA